MSIEANKKLNRQWIQAFNERDWAAEAACRTEDYTAHMQGAPVTLDGEGWAGYLQMFVGGFPDVQISVDAELGEGNLVTSRWTLAGTHLGGFLGAPATGRQVAITGIDISRVVDGRIAEHWAQFDGVGLMQQIGVAPGPGGADVEASGAYR
ncbi:MAG TPA: ester cyclase [Acidimicrobiales bacterium]|nr:ester cyclase [Acidimicrobiales bacterium]